MAHRNFAGPGMAHGTKRLPNSVLVIGFMSMAASMYFMTAKSKLTLQTNKNLNIQPLLIHHLLACVTLLCIIYVLFYLNASELDGINFGLSCYISIA